jgi:glutamine synthetase
LKNIFELILKNVAKEIILIKDISKHIEGINSKVVEMTNERKKGMY